MRRPLRLLAIALLPSLLAANEDMPPAGQSLFDQLINSEQITDDSIPYPFSRLLESLQSHLGFTGEEIHLATILIPRGRSLHREAAHPDYYQFPRVVIALDRDGPSLELVKYRLFLGYQERAESIEVISYNETAGRFEFQVVENYAAGKTASVSYANRALCTSCHQNDAAIFSRPLWRESNFNREVAAKIGQYHDHYHGVGTGSGHAHADRIDFATDQANLLSAYQRVWQQGCPNDGCRASLFLAALLRKLDSGELPDYAWLSQEREILNHFEVTWKQNWPRGMPVASGDITDRINLDGEDPMSTNQIPSTPRAPLSYWSARTATIRTLEGLADQFLPDSGIRRLQELGLSIQQIETAVQNLQSRPETANLFVTRPIPGAQLMRELLLAIDIHE